MSEPITNVEAAVAVQGALPMPAGPELQPLKVFVALYDGAEPEVFTTAAAARDCCDDLVKVDAADGRGWDWVVNEDGVHVQFWTHVDDDRPLSETSGTVTPVVVQGLLPELERLRSQAVDAMSDAELLRKQGETLRTQVAEARELTVFRAEYEEGGMPLGTYDNLAAARKHCEVVMRRDLPFAEPRWLVDDEDESAGHELVAVVDGEEQYTGYFVTPLEVASEYDEEADE